MTETRREDLPPCPAGLSLVYEADGLTLTDDAGLSMRGDFLQMRPRLTKNRVQGELLVKAAKLKGAGPFTVLDATAGMGEDSMLLACAGFQVELYEQDPVIAALLSDALERAKADPQLGEAAQRMHLHGEDSIAAMREGKIAPDVVFLDPMFPERRKSALIKKKFQLLQKLERPCSDEEELLEAAMSLRPRKIVIKRPLKGPYLAGKKPDYTLSGKAIRYDCFVFARGKAAEETEKRKA